MPSVSVSELIKKMRLAFVSASSFGGGGAAGAGGSLRKAKVICESGMLTDSLREGARTQG